VKAGGKDFQWRDLSLLALAYWGIILGGTEASAWTPMVMENCDQQSAFLPFLPLDLRYCLRGEVACSS
jgi:hypothetical protein